MTIRDLINTSAANPHLLDREIVIVTGTEKFDSSKYPDNPMPENPNVTSAMLDGATIVKCRPIESITVAGPNGAFMVFVNPNKESELQSMFLENAEMFPQIVVCGQVPTALKF